jgi:hypothetical protein
MLFDTVTRRGVVCFVPDSGHVCGCTCLLCVCVCLYASTCVCERPDRLFPLHPATLSPHCHLLLTRGDLSSIMAHFDIARAPTMSTATDTGSAANMENGYAEPSPAFNPRAQVASLYVYLSMYRLIDRLLDRSIHPSIHPSRLTCIELSIDLSIYRSVYSYIVFHL